MSLKKSTYACGDNRVALRLQLTWGRSWLRQCVRKRVEVNNGGVRLYESMGEMIGIIVDRYYRMWI
jgi:hypothetical protein